MIHTAKIQYNVECFYICCGIREKVVYFEEEYHRLKELALWKLRMSESILLEKATPCQKKVKTDEWSTRMQCRITCGVDVVIRHVLPYLIVSVADEESKHPQGSAHRPTSGCGAVPMDAKVFVYAGDGMIKSVPKQVIRFHYLRNMARSWVYVLSGMPSTSSSR